MTYYHVTRRPKTAAAFRGRIALLLAALLLLVASSTVAAAAVGVDEIFANSQAVMDKAKTMSLNMAMTQVAPDKSEMKIRATILGDRGLGIYRITMLEPAAMADQVIVIDTKAKKMRMYMPVSNQIIVRSLDEGGAGAAPGGMGFDFSRLSQLPSQKDYDIKLTSVQKTSSGDVYVLSVTAKKKGAQGGISTGTQKVWIRSDDWMVSKVELYDDKGQLQGTILLQDLKLNPKLTKTQLTQLPKDAQVVEQ